MPSGSNGSLELIEIGTVVQTGVDDYKFIYEAQENDDSVWRGQYLKASVHAPEREVSIILQVWFLMMVLLGMRLSVSILPLLVWACCWPL